MPYNPDRINIHELTVEEPERKPELLFDPGKDILEEDWKKMEKELENNKYRAWLFPMQAVAMKVLNPNYVLSLDPNIWKNMEDELREYKERKDNRLNNTTSIAKLAMYMKIIDPSREGDLDQKSWDRVEKLLKPNKDGLHWSWLPVAAAAKVVNPSRNVGVYSDSINELRDQRGDGFAEYAMYLKIFDPGYPLGLDQIDWEKMRNRLNKYRKEQTIREYMEQAMIMTILAAGEVTVPPGGGLEVVMKKDNSFDVKPSPLPEAKQF